MTAPTTPAPPIGRAALRRAGLAAACDLLCVVAFVLIGRRSHDEATGLAGFVRIAWPFASGLVVAATVGLLGRWRPWTVGTATWIGTVAIGLALRIGVQDRSFEVAFVIVTTTFLGLTMLGWRTVAWVVVPRLRRTRAR